MKKEGFAYRVYDMEAVTRLRQIVILRKLRIPLKQIADILQSEDSRVAIEAFERSLAEIEDEITALSTIRSVIKAFVDHLHLESAIFALPDDEGLLEMVDSLTVSKMNFKEEKSRLLTSKPDARSFGFDCSNEATALGQASHVYEVWVSAPDDMQIPLPLVKRTFSGGLYAAHVLRSWDFEDWRFLKEWVNESGKYDNDWGSPRWTSQETKAGQGFEETLNFYHLIENGRMEDLQLDLLFPIKEKVNGL